MKRILLIVAMLLMAAPVFAVDDVTVTATDEGIVDGHGWVRVRFTAAADVNIRAFALDINVDNQADINSIHDFNVGDINSFGIFPGKFRDVPINPVDPNWKDQGYNPISGNETDTTGTGLGTNKIIVELGTLLADPCKTGTLFRLDVNGHGPTDCNLTVNKNDLRGGVVKQDATAATTNLPITIKVTLPPPPGPELCTVPNVVGGLCTAAPGLITGNGLLVGDVTDAYSDTVAAGVVISQDPPASPPQVDCGSEVDYVCSLGKPAVPNVVGQLCVNAPGIITAVDNLVVGTVKNDYNCTVPAGTVISQYPVATTLVNIGAAVDYNCSLGTWPEPNVSTMWPADANTALINAHYVVGTIDYNWSPTIAKGKVLTQLPVAGPNRPCGTVVNYTKSQGPIPWACFDPCTAATAQKARYLEYVNAKWDPNCWCEYHAVKCPGCGFQCHGDADGKKTAAPASLRVYNLDLGMVTGNWGRKLLPYPNGANPCADVDHKATAAPASIRVYTLDLQRLTSATVGNWARKGCIEATGTLPRNCPYSDAKNNAAYVKPLACNEPK